MMNMGNWILLLTCSSDFYSNLKEIQNLYAKHFGGTMELKSVKIELPENSNIIIGQTHFIKSIEDLYEIMVSISSQIKFGIAFCEASGLCLIRVAGNDATLQNIATRNAEAIAAGHSFVKRLG
jgi:adenosine/AMP kinase